MQAADRRETLWLVGLLGVTWVACLASGFLRQSLWLDETISAWISNASFSQATERTLRYQGQSPLYYWALWAWRGLVGSSELRLRLLSVIFLTAAATYVFLLGRLLFEKHTAIVAVIVFYGLDTINVAMSARPYALAMMATLGAIFHFCKWLEEKRSQDGVLFFLLTVVAFYAHYLFIGFLIVPLYLWVQKGKGNAACSTRTVLITAVLAAVIILPGFEHFFSLWKRSEALSFAPAPDLYRVIQALFPKEVAIPLVFSMFAAWIVFPSRLRFAQSKMKPTVLLLWWLFPIVIFGAHAVLSGGSLFMERYYLWYTPAIAFCGALCLTGFERHETRRFASVVMVLFVVVRMLDRNWKIEDWRGAIQTVQSIQAKEPQPVLLYSGLIEGSHPPLHDNETTQYLSAPFLVYGPDIHPILIPPALSDSMQQRYFDERVAPLINSHDRFLLIFLNKKMEAVESSPQYIADSYRNFFQEKLFEWTDLNSNMVRVALLKRQQPTKESTKE